MVLLDVLKPPPAAWKAGGELADINPLADVFYVRPFIERTFRCEKHQQPEVLFHVRMEQVCSLERSPGFC